MKEWKGRNYSFEFVDPGKPVLTWRTRRPGHFVFEIESYSKLVEALKNAGMTAFETPEFDAGGNKWSLLFYYNGNTPRGGQGYISIYLKRHGNRVARSNTIDVAVKFFILDQIGDEYLVIEDIGERVFDVRGNQWGIAQALRKDDFEDKKHGFLIEDRCTIGAEVFVTTSDPRYSKLVKIKRISSPRFQVRFHPLAQLSEPADSQILTTVLDGESYRWKLQLYKEGDAEGTGTHFSLYLELVDTDKLSNGRSLFVSFDISLKNKKTGVYGNKMSKLMWYTSSVTSGGFSEFIKNEDFYNQALGYDTGNALDAEINFNSIFVLKGMDDSDDN